MSICFEKARELADLILNSPESAKLRDIVEKLSADSNITRMISEFDSYREAFASDIEKGSLTKTENDSRVAELTRMYELLQKESLMQARKQAEAEYENLVNGVMDILNMTLGRNADKCSGCMNKCG